ncbi:uncharacterized protein LOC110460583 isoform X2 [Mizuhopecten yessoensis]|uniref:uncharacterized protein LOC110460583 isoform X2 n=1 Tax=Mizuhopecten yessoensis TaxID=6573 RepID=UPI000B45CA6E|nr:uncharacterized protein LOC110460583 isoform X2 [Mizuhopecten yessoensis]
MCVAKQAIRLKYVLGAKKVNYCSKKCQRQDWKIHKLQCKDPEEDVYETITTDGYRREETFASESARSTGSGAFNRCRHFPKLPDLSQRSYFNAGAFDKVKSLTWKVFPGCTILDFVREIPHELFGKRPRSTSRVAVGFISRYHSYVSRHCIFLQDKDGDEVYVGFYFERDEPRPYFQWSDVVPGRYLCIADPYIHQFLDGSDKINKERMVAFCLDHDDPNNEIPSRHLIKLKSLQRCI